MAKESDKKELLALATSVVEALRKPFAEADITYDAPKADGFKAASIRWEKIAARLDEVLGGAWSFQVVSYQLLHDRCIVHGRLVVQCQMGDQFREVVKDGIGSSEVFQNDLGSSMKSAASDALKRAAVLFGVGAHLYDKDAQKTQMATQAAAVQGQQENQPAQPFQIAAVRALLQRYAYPEPHAVQYLRVVKLEDITSIMATQLISGQHPLTVWLAQQTGQQQTAGLRAGNA